MMWDVKLSVKKRGPTRSWLSEKSWNYIVKTMSIPCVDMIFQRQDGSILFGWRLIKPYGNVWALPGGRILRGENLLQCAARIGKEYGLSFERLYLNGVFPINFQRRVDIPICLAARQVSGDPLVDDFEFSKFIWRKNPPTQAGTNYVLMVSKWQRASTSREFLGLNRLM
jgi:ADP-ribose pyrophosphatase YjhB (NUDIX family)